ncbi:MAG: heme ABC transporter ATP-binding protein [Pseudomonadota bacterium]|nr:heme ABC transporter ATP-binding protein [Pseudomonadota bacterium]
MPVSERVDMATAQAGLHGGEHLDSHCGACERPALDDEQALRAEGVGVSVGATALLRGVNVTLHAGRVTALLGPNGAGKSTLLGVLAGQRQPTRGQARLAGRALAQWRGDALARVRAVMPQHGPVAFDFRVGEIVALGRYPHRLRPSAHEAAIVPAALALTGVTHLADRHYASLSGGEQARTQLARVLAQLWEPAAPGAPRWLLLDEPTAALDWAHQMQLMDTVRRWAHAEGVGVVVVLHDLNLALRYADDAVVLSQGTLVAAGACAEVLTPALVQQIWQVRCQRLDLGDGVARLAA